MVSVIVLCPAPTVGTYRTLSANGKGKTPQFHTPTEAARDDTAAVRVLKFHPLFHRHPWLASAGPSGLVRCQFLDYRP